MPIDEVLPGALYLPFEGLKTASGVYVTILSIFSYVVIASALYFREEGYIFPREWGEKPSRRRKITRKFKWSEFTNELKYGLSRTPLAALIALYLFFSIPTILAFAFGFLKDSKQSENYAEFYFTNTQLTVYLALIPAAFGYIEKGYYRFWSFILLLLIVSSTVSINYVGFYVTSVILNYENNLCNWNENRYTNTCLSIQATKDTIPKASTY